MKNKKEKSIDDNRGYLYEFTDKQYQMRQSNILFSYKSNVRGNHYHKKMTEVFFILNGMVEVKLFFIKRNIEKVFTVKTGDEFTIEPYTVHTLKFMEDTKMLSFYSHPFNPDDTDIYHYKKSKR